MTSLNLYPWLMRFRRCGVNREDRVASQTKFKVTEAMILNRTVVNCASGGIKPVLAKRRTEHGSGLGVYRWVVERTISWLHQFRRLRIRYERLPEIHEAFLSIGCALICWNFL